MKAYEVLCRTCGGTGFIDLWSPHGMTTAPTTEVCPVCNGSKKQTITETTPVVVHNESIMTT